MKESVLPQNACVIYNNITRVFYFSSIYYDYQGSIIIIKRNILFCIYLHFKAIYILN